MDEKTKKKLNKAIAVIRDYCDEKRNCEECPLQVIFCDGDMDDPKPPYSWYDID